MRLLNHELMPKAMMDDQVLTEDRISLGQKDHVLDALGTHVGGCMHVDPCVEWFRINRQYCPKLSEIEECEREAK